jgi:RNA polymerase sigma-70 factor, ECF subfamily
MEGVSSVENAPAVVDAREAGLIRSVQNGEREYFYALVQPYERKLYAAAYSILRNEQDAEDAVQEAMLKALKNLGQFRFEAKFSTWLIQITINEARMRRRKQNARVMEPIGETANDEGTYTPRDFADWREIPSESLERKEVRELLLEALASLGEKYREIFILRDVNHLSIKEVSKTLGISHASVKTRLLRARLMLRDLLAPKMSTGWFKSGLFNSAPLQKGTKPW